MNTEKPNAQFIFAEALRLSVPAERRAYLNQACGGDEALRQEVESLLAAHEQAGEFLQSTVALPIPNSPVEKPGDRIGRYKLLEQIGEGGFGVVYMAEQEEPVRRRVALKIIKLGMDTKEVVARFEAERQALALMDHPNIATVFDGGATNTGRPYFVMELVKGIPITRFCDEGKLTTRGRLELFMEVCHAVQHAHQKGVIHRDLKPSNILVTVRDDRPVPKVIDFGVAKATQARLTQKTLFTRFQQWIGTPAYMSPEQAGLGSLDVDTRSDIYSLGVLLYELLTGRTPFDTEKLLAAGYDAVMRTIREEEPPKPSKRLSTLKVEELTTVAANRHAEPTKLNRLVRGDLDWIAMKALEKDRQRRYDTAMSLAHDIERHLRAEPVSAAAPGLFYRTGKFVRRNRARIAFATLALVAVVLAVAGVKLALNYYPARRAFQAAGTNAVFTLAKSGDSDALRKLLDANPRLIAQQDAGGMTPLAYAAEAGKTNTLRQLLIRGADVNATNRLGWTPLMSAALRGHADAVAALLRAGADPNHVGAEGRTALEVSVWCGNLEVGRLLLDKGAQTGGLSPPPPMTALHEAALLGYADFVQLLLDHGAPADIRDAHDFTPLHWAAMGPAVAAILKDVNSRNYHAAVRALRDQGLESAAVGLSNWLGVATFEGPEVLQHYAGQHRRVSKLLLAHKASLEATNNLSCTPLLLAAAFTNLPVAEVLVAYGANPNAVGPQRVRPLAIAARRSDAELAALLLGAGAKPNLVDAEGFSPLHTAIEHGNVQVAKALLAAKADPNLACPKGQVPMHVAAERGDLECMRLLLNNGAVINPLAPGGTPLTWAVEHGQTEAVKFLLEQGAKPDMAPPQTGLTALHWAAIMGFPVLAQLLLASGATVDASSVLGTPLHCPAAGRRWALNWISNASRLAPPGRKVSVLSPGSEDDYKALVRILIAAKAKVNAVEPNYQRTPLHIAVYQGHVAAVELLLAAGANVAAVDKENSTPLHRAALMDATPAVISNIVARLLLAGASVEAQNKHQATPLHDAANSGNAAMAALLLEAGAPINAKGPYERTPLQLAVLRGARDVVKLLLARGATLECRDAEDATALHGACALRAHDTAALLLDAGANPDAPSSDGSTALMWCANVGDGPLIKLLLDHGARVDATNHAGWTALLQAAQAGKLEAARLLLDRGAKIDLADSSAITPLIIAAKSGRLETVKFLLERGAQITAANTLGLTALHEAADRGHADIVEFLLNHGMQVDQRSHSECTPLHYAAYAYWTNETHYVAVARVLLEYGADVNARNRQKQTPLHRAADRGRPRVIEVLLGAKPNLDARDENAKTALDLATDPGGPRLRPDVATGRKECAALLQSDYRTHTPDTKIQKLPQSPSGPAGAAKP